MAVRSAVVNSSTTLSRETRRRASSWNWRGRGGGSGGSGSSAVAGAVGRGVGLSSAPADGTTTVKASAKFMPPPPTMQFKKQPPKVTSTEAVVPPKTTTPPSTAGATAASQTTKPAKRVEAMESERVPPTTTPKPPAAPLATGHLVQGNAIGHQPPQPMTSPPQARRIVRHDGLRHADDIVALLRSLVADGPCSIADIPDATLRMLLGDAAFGTLPPRRDSGDGADVERVTALRRKLSTVLSPVHVISVDGKRSTIRIRPGVEAIAARAQAIAEHSPLNGAGHLPLSAIFSVFSPQEKRAANECGGLMRVLLVFADALPLTNNQQSLNVGAMRRNLASAAAAAAADARSAAGSAQAPSGRGAAAEGPGGGVAATLAAARSANEAREIAERERQATALELSQGKGAVIGAALFGSEGILNEADDADTVISFTTADGVSRQVLVESESTARDIASAAVAAAVPAPGETIDEARAAALRRAREALASPAPSMAPIGINRRKRRVVRVEAAPGGSPVSVDGDAGASSPRQEREPKTPPWFKKAALAPAEVTRVPSERLLRALSYEWVDANPALARAGSRSLANLPVAIERRSSAFGSFLRRRPPAAAAVPLSGGSKRAEAAGFLAGLSAGDRTTADAALRQLVFEEVDRAALVAAHDADGRRAFDSDPSAAHTLARVASATSCGVGSLEEGQAPETWGGDVPARTVEYFFDSDAADGYDTAYTPDWRMTVAMCRDAALPGDWTQVDALAQGATLAALGPQTAAALQGSRAHLAFHQGALVDLRFRRPLPAELQGDKGSDARNATGEYEPLTEVRRLIPARPPADVVVAVAVVIDAVGHALELAMGDDTVPVERLRELVAVADEDAAALAPHCSNTDDAARSGGLSRLRSALALEIRAHGGLDALLRNEGRLFHVSREDGSGDVVALTARGRALVENQAASDRPAGAADTDDASAVRNTREVDGGPHGDGWAVEALRRLSACRYLAHALGKTWVPYLPSKGGAQSQQGAQSQRRAADAIPRTGATYVLRRPQSVLAHHDRTQPLFRQWLW